MVLPGRLSHEIRACTYLVPPLLARSLRPRSGRVIASEAEGIRGAPNLPDSAVPYQLKYFGNKVFDFREKRVHPQLMDANSDEKNLPYLNAYPVFEQSKEDNYGQIDQPFNAKGYALYGKFLYDVIEPDVRALIDTR